jgi:hypothetical protein
LAVALPLKTNHSSITIDPQLLCLSLFLAFQNRTRRSPHLFMARVLDVFGLKAVMQSRPLSATADIEQPCRKDGA